MSKYRCEMFCHFVYSEKMTYQELLDKEAEIGEAMRSILGAINAAHINFAQYGDNLLAQCVLNDFDQNIFHQICDATVPFLDSHVIARFLFVDKYLEGINFYMANGTGWRESALNLPHDVFEALATECKSKKVPLPANRGKRNAIK